MGLIQAEWAFVPGDVFLKELLFTGSLATGTMETSAQPGLPPQPGEQGAPLKKAGVVAFVSIALPSVFVKADVRLKSWSSE